MVVVVVFLFFFFFFFFFFYQQPKGCYESLRTGPFLQACSTSMAKVGPYSLCLINIAYNWHFNWHLPTTSLGSLSCFGFFFLFIFFFFFLPFFGFQSSSCYNDRIISDRQQANWHWVRLKCCCLVFCFNSQKRQVFVTAKTGGKHV